MKMFCEVVVILSILEYIEILPSTYRMDYVPVFVWLQRRSSNDSSTNPEHWWSRYVTYDFTHYRARTDTLPLNTFDRTIYLKMTEQWHSLEYDEEKYEKSLKKCYTCPVCLCWILLFFIIAGPIFKAIELVLSLKILVFDIVPILVCIAGEVVRMEKWEIIQNDDDYTDGEAYLDESKLLILWNLKETARLKIVTKLMDSFRYFNPDKGQEFESFDVETKDILSRL